jgi:hypothetical protein
VSTLAQIQRAVQDSVLAHDPSVAAPVIARTQGAASAHDRLNIYLRGYVSRLTEILRNDYSGLSILVGGAKFDEIAEAYIAAHPSREFNARWYGAGLADFLRRSALDSQGEAAAEMATLDWAIGLCFDSPDEAHVTPLDLQNIAPDQWPTIRFALSPCIERRSFAWNVGEIRRAIDRAEPIPNLRPLGDEQAWVISRVETRIFHRALPLDEAAALDTIAAQGTFADVCERLGEMHPDEAVVQRAAEMLRAWVESRWLIRVSAAT